MCSYGGHIVPRRHKNSLFYFGGETHIVAVDRRTSALSLSSLTLHLSRTLYNNRLFTLKYQLPNEDLESLISITTDEDLNNMLEEHDRLVSSLTPSRIRLFLFPSKPESVGSLLLDPKSESWFCDALKSTMIINRGLSADSGVGNALMGLDRMGDPDSLSGEGKGESGEGNRNGFDSGSVPESMVLETCSSFGSMSSSVLMSNLPPIGVHGEDGGANLLDKKVKVASSASSIESDNCAASAVSHSKIGIYQDQVLHASSPDMNVSSNSLESERIIYDPSSTTQMHRVLQVPGYQLPYLPEQKHQQEVQYIHAGAHYVQQYLSGPLPISSYHPMYRPYQQNHPYPVYLMPVRPTAQSYNMSMACDIHENATGSLSLPHLHPHTAVINPRVTDKEVMVSQQSPEVPSSDLYRMVPSATPVNSVPSNHNQQQFVAPPEAHHALQSLTTASTGNVSCDNEYDDDLAYAQIYKSQPPAPALPPNFQTMAKAATESLSDSSAQLHADNVRQQVGTSQPH